MEKSSKPKEYGTDVRIEVIIGLTAFFTMSYVLFANPSILSQIGMPAQGVLLATIIGAVVGTSMTAFYANPPYAQAPGMGLNTFFTYTAVFSLGYTQQEASAIVFICELISLVTAVTKIRKLIIESIPTALKSAISAGIGASPAYAGIKNVGFLRFLVDVGTYAVPGTGVDKGLASIIANALATPGLVAFDIPAIILALTGLATTIFFIVKSIRGGVILSIAATTIVGILMGVVDLGSINRLMTNSSASINDLKQVFGAALRSQGLGSLFSDASRIPGVLMAILTFSLTDIFDTIGTLTGIGEKVGTAAITGEDKEFRSLDRALYSDLVGTASSATVGTSSVAIYAESAADIGAGGHTGLTTLVVAVLFAILNFFSPLVSTVPTQVTAPIPIVVGVMMLSDLKNAKWDDLSEAIPALFTSIFMGFSYNITCGIAAGSVTYALIKTVKGQAKDVHFVMWILDLLFILNFIRLAVL